MQMRRVCNTEKLPCSCLVKSCWCQKLKQPLKRVLKIRAQMRTRNQSTTHFRKRLSGLDFFSLKDVNNRALSVGRSRALFTRLAFSFLDDTFSCIRSNRASVVGRSFDCKTFPTSPGLLFAQFICLIMLIDGVFWCAACPWEFDISGASSIVLLMRWLIVKLIHFYYRFYCTVEWSLMSVYQRIVLYTPGWTCEFF